MSSNCFCFGVKVHFVLMFVRVPSFNLVFMRLKILFTFLVYYWTFVFIEVQCSKLLTNM